ncbi:MAG TPA: hypothetical protein PLD43_12575, partial [Anaerolineae bacterium]|nr:hypothetical protein [Anaerolineae bacterium]
ARTDRLAIIRSMTHDDPAHLSSAHRTLTGHLAPKPFSDADGPGPNDSPHLGALVARLRPTEGKQVLPTAVTAQAQARIAVSNILGQLAYYENLAPTTTLKVMGIEVNSMGTINPPADAHEAFQFTTPDASVYRKIVLQHADGGSVIVGAITINDKVLAKKLGALIEQRAPLTAAEAQSLVKGV